MRVREQLYWEHFGYAGALSISTFVLLGLMLRLRETKSTRAHLWAMVAFFTVTFLDNIDSIVFSDFFDVPDMFYGWYYILIPGFIIALYFYVRAMTEATPGLRRSDVVHVVPFLLSFLVLSPSLALPGAVRRGHDDPSVSDTHLWLADLGDSVFWSLWILWLVIYGGFSMRRLVLHKRRILALFSDLEGKTLRWLDGLVATIFALAMFVIVDEIRDLMELPSLRVGLVSMGFNIILPLSFGIFALRANPVLPEWTDTVLPAPSPPEGPQTDTPETPQRYSRSGLQQADIERLALRLEKRMAEGQIWRDHSLNLRSLAAQVSVPPIHLSEVLNTELGMTFYDYVNQCRIKDACDLLITTDSTILEISETVGFNAKSTFNTSFKKVTDQTPSQWRARHRP